MEKMNTPNETTKKLEELRRDSIKNAYRKPKEDEKPKEQEEVEEKVEKKLDNDQENSYINKDESSSENEVEEKYKELLEKQFKGDPVKAVKSWSETQREFMKLRNSVEEKDQYFNKLSKMLDDNPILAEAIEKAENNEDIESFFASKFQESDKDKPVKETKSKPNITDDSHGVDEKTLIESGYLDPSEREFTNAEDWESKKRQASIRYMYNELPDRLAEQAAKKYQEQIERLNKEKQSKELENKNKSLIEERWLDGVEKISVEYGFDFVNNDEHQQLLKDIQRRASAYRDPDNFSVIDKEAVEIATQQVLRERNLLDQFKVEEPKRPGEEKQLYEKNQMNVNVRPKQTIRSTTVADKLRDRHLKEHERQMAKRTNTRKNN